MQKKTQKMNIKERSKNQKVKGLNTLPVQSTFHSWHPWPRPHHNVMYVYQMGH